MPENPNRPKVTIEDLLRFKRAEKPGPEFWSHFEQELRAKQLAAIVEKRVWWRASADVLLAWRLPLGAALAVGLVSVVAIRQVSAPSSESPATDVATSASVQAPTSAAVASATEKPVQAIAANVAASSGPMIDRGPAVQVADSTPPAEPAARTADVREIAVATAEPAVDFFSENPMSEEIALPSLAADLPVPEDGSISTLFASVTESSNVDPLSQVPMPQTMRNTMIQEALRKSATGESLGNLTRVGYLAVSENKLRNLNSTVGL